MDGEWERRLREAWVEEPPRLDGTVLLAGYDPEWARLYEREAARIRGVLGDRVLVLEHIGSTSVPGLAAKPVIDILLVVAEPGDEETYVPDLERAGYRLVIREPDWYQHRLLKGPDTDINLHVHPPGSPEIARNLRFRDRLRDSETDRQLYEQAKRQLAGRHWTYVQQYADAKSDVIEMILRGNGSGWRKRGHAAARVILPWEPRRTVVADAARSMWTLFEPIHAVVYFAPEARAAFERAGLRGFWRGYFAGRAAPLGMASPAVVTASFFNFAPAFVARAIPGVWELITPEEALRTRVAGAVDALRGPLAGRESDVQAAADLLWQAIAQLDCSGRVLAAANAALPVPGRDPGPGRDAGPGPSPDLAAGPDAGPGAGLDASLARLWQAATVLREHRGDGHFAALAAADIDGCEALALRCRLDLRREDLQPVRGWTDEAWDAALSRLAARGWIGADGELTSAGREAHAAVEDATDRAAGRPWASLGPEATAEAAKALTPLAQACANSMPYPSPIGVPAPRAVT